MKNLFNRLVSSVNRRALTLLAIVLCASGILIAVNYLTIKTTTSVRAYVNGESLYSKGQKDASRYLILYLVEHDEEYYHRFLEEIQVPLGDSIARVELSSGGDRSVARQGFLQGKNHPEDVDHLIWLFEHFQQISFMQEAIQIWKDADAKVGELMRMGETIHQNFQQEPIDAAQQTLYISQINQITNSLTEKERAFSHVLGVAARQISELLFWINLVIILIVLISASVFTSVMIRELENSREDLRINNAALISTNQKLDSFIYASSHDLKSPINNLEGLLHLLESRTDTITDWQAQLIDKMKLSSSALKETISDIERLLEVDRDAGEDVEDINFSDLLHQILMENEMSFNLGNAEIVTNFEVPTLRYSRIALKSVIYNLVSNAAKYRSPNRKLVISISTFDKDNRTHFQIKDNGLGINLKLHGTNLFKMFKRFHPDVQGSGLGLYAVKQIVEKNNGSISVVSEPDAGCAFTVVL
jgi:signal transduction histidine kinase